MLARNCPPCDEVIAHDALDRPLTRTTPPAGLDDDDFTPGIDDLARYAIGTTEFHYDQTGHANGLGRLTTVELPAGSGTTTYEYTVEGWVSEETRSFSVAPHGAVISDQRTIKRTYNAMGALERTVHADDPDAPTVTLAEYDERGLPHALYLDPLPEEPAPSPGGNPPSLDPIRVTPDGRHSFAAPTMLNRTFSIAGFEKVVLTQTATEPEPSHTLLAKLDRNLAGAVTRRTSDFAQAQTWGYDDLGRIRAGIIRACPGQYGISASQSCATSGSVIGGEHLTYTSLGNVRTVTDAASGKSIRYTYDAQHQLATAVSTPAADYAANFLYSPAGRVTEAYVSGTGPGVLERDVLYDYPDIGAADADPSTVSALQPRATTVDPDDLLGGFGGTGGTTTEPADPVASFTYDPRGNLTSRTVGDTTWTFIYDGDDRLREAIRNQAGTETREVYFYDHNNQRTLAAATATPAEPARTRFWFAETELTYSDDATAIRQEVHATLGAMPVARLTRGTADTTATGEPEIQLTYHGTLGSLLATAGTDSHLTAAYRYGPFGEILDAAGPEASTHTRLFNGKELDTLTDLGYYGYRYYDRLTLTWTQADPLYRFVPDLAYGDPRRMGLYTFVLNNPLRYVDPDGLEGNEPDAGVPETNMDAGVRSRAALPLCGSVAGPQDCLSAKEYEELCDVGHSKCNLSTGEKIVIAAGITAMFAPAFYVVISSVPTITVVSASKGGSIGAPVLASSSGGGGVVFGATLINAEAAPAAAGGLGAAVGLYLLSQQKGSSSSGGNNEWTPRVLQTGGRTIRHSTADALNQHFQVNYHRREWGRALESLKRQNDLSPNHHGKILETGDYLDDVGNLIDNIGAYLP